MQSSRIWAGEQVDSELERELVEALEGGYQCESD